MCPPNGYPPVVQTDNLGVVVWVLCAALLGMVAALVAIACGAI